MNLEAYFARIGYELTTAEVIDALRDVFGLLIDGDMAAALAAKLDAQAGSAGLPA